jgi:hypothetical protein
MNIQTSKLNALWLVTKPDRSDLNAFCSDPQQLANKLFELSIGSLPIVYDVQFWLKTPKFKRLTKIQLKKILDFNLAEKRPGPKDRNFYNASEKWERAYLPKRKTTARTYTKKKTLAASDKPILNKTQMRRFLSWIRQGNATQIEPGIWLEQTTQGMQEFTYEELQKFFKKEYT